MFEKFLLIFLLHLIKCDEVEITIPLGRMMGLKTKTFPAGKMYYSFKGVRYAEPPPRFEPSTPKRPWRGVYNATEDQAFCIQAAVYLPTASEDCLFLNVYTPALPSDGPILLPVMFWIHGGGFIQGTGAYTQYIPDYFMDENVVIVNLNYRLGIFGFLSTGDGRVPGNNGMKDIILGLQWVQNYIRYFNGDPTKVTIFGESAGSALTSYLAISPLTQGKDYFIRAISESGNALSPWALQRYPKRNYHQVLLKSACLLFETTGWDLICLKMLSTDAIAIIETAVMGINAVIGIDIMNGITFSPVYEVPNPTAVLLDGSYKVLLEGTMTPVPFIMGVNSEEGVALQPVMDIIRPFFLQADQFPAILVPDDMHASEMDKVDFIVPQIRNYYFDNQLVVTSTDNKIVRFISDSMFNKPFREYLTLVGNRVPHYCYQFTYVGNPSMHHPVQRYIERVGHAEELEYLWRNFENITLSQKDLRIKDKMVRMWTNFAKFGNPTPVFNDALLDGVIWTPSAVNGTDVSCLSIDDELVMVRNPKESGYRMWQQLYDNYGHPYDTY